MLTAPVLPVTRLDDDDALLLRQVSARSVKKPALQSKWRTRSVSEITSDTY